MGEYDVCQTRAECRTQSAFGLLPAAMRPQRSENEAKYLTRQTCREKAPPWRALAPSADAPRWRHAPHRSTGRRADCNAMVKVKKDAICKVMKLTIR